MKKILNLKIRIFLFGYFFMLSNFTLNSQSYDIDWTSFINTAASGSTLTKIAGGNNWGNGAAISTNTIPANTDGWTEYTATAKINLMVGLSTPNNVAHFNSIKYAAHINPGAYFVYENGSLIQNFGAYNIGDVFRVERIGTTIYYKRNGTTFYTSTIPSAEELITDASIYTEGHSVNGAKSSHPLSINTVNNNIYPY